MFQLSTDKNLVRFPTSLIQIYYRQSASAEFKEKKNVETKAPRLNFSVAIAATATVDYKLMLDSIERQQLASSIVACILGRPATRNNGSSGRVNSKRDA